MRWPWQVKAATKDFLNGMVWVPSSEPVDIYNKAKEDTGPLPEQTRAWRLWKCVGELHSPTSYIARIVSRRLEWRITAPVEMDAAKTAQVLTGYIPNLEEFIRLIVLNLQVAGEFWLIQTKDSWEVMSVIDPKKNPMIKEAKASGRVVQRVYDPDPSNTAFADSAMFSVLDPAEEILTLSMLSRAQSRSRIAQAGMLLVPSEVTFAGGDPFGTGLQQAMTAAIRDVSSPAALSPIKVSIPSEYIDKVKHVNFDRPFDDGVQEKITKAITRIALGLDIPPELLLGLGQNSSHWGAWAVQEETYKGSTSPLAERVASVLELVIRTMTGEPSQVSPDPTDLLSRRSTTRDAFEGARIGAVGLQYVRKTMGASELDKPTPEDISNIRAVSTTGRGSNVAGDQIQEAPNGGEPR